MSIMNNKFKPCRMPQNQLKKLKKKKKGFYLYKHQNKLINLNYANIIFRFYINTFHNIPYNGSLYLCAMFIFVIEKHSNLHKYFIK